MTNNTLRSRVARMFDRNCGDDAILDLISEEITFSSCQQAIINRFCTKHKLPQVTATCDGRGFLMASIADSHDGNEEEFDCLMALHEALEDESQWMLTQHEAYRRNRLALIRQQGVTLTPRQEQSFQRLQLRLTNSGVASPGWTAAGGDGETITLLPWEVTAPAKGVAIGKDVPADLKERIQAAVLAIVGAATAS